MAEISFQHEKRFLFATLVAFSISYMIEVTKNSVMFWALDKNDNHDDAKDNWICKSNFNMSLYNIVSWTFTELIPYIVIFSLNYGNFSQMDRQDEYMEEQFKKRYEKVANRN